MKIRIAHTPSLKLLAASIALIFATPVAIRADQATEPQTAIQKTSASKKGGGLLSFFMGLPMKKALGLSRGEIAEFTMGRVRIENAAVSSGRKPIKGETITDTTFLTVKEVIVEFDAWEILTKRTVKKVVVDRPQIWISQMESGGEAAGVSPNEKKDSGMLIQHLEIRDGLLHLDTLRERGITIPLQFAWGKPLLFKNFYIGDPTQSAEAKEVRAFTIEKVLVQSAFGPLAPLLEIPKIELRFSFDGLYRNQIESLVIEKPLVFVGNDWFMILDEFNGQAKKEASMQKKKDAINKKQASKSAAPKQPMLLKSFQIRGLSLALSSFGLVELRLPFGFNYDVQNVKLDKNGDFFLSSKLTINERQFSIPHVMDVTGLDGEMRFNWPPQDGSANNIVPTIKAEKMVFVETPARKKIEITKPYLSFTMQRVPKKGAESEAGEWAKQNIKAFLKLGMHIDEKGYLDGGVDMDFDGNWKSWLTGSNLNLQVLNAFTAQIISGEFNAQLNASGKGMKINEGSHLHLWRPTRNAVIDLNLAGNLDDFFSDENASQENLDAGGSATDKERLEDWVDEQRKRSGEIQKLKNASFVGENRSGYLEKRTMETEKEYPGGTRLIEAENKTRKSIYKLIAQSGKRLLKDVENEMGERWAIRAFPNEWFQSTDGAWHRK